MNFIIREMDKENDRDWEFFDELQFDSFRGSQRDGDEINEEEMLARYKKFDEDDLIDYTAQNQIMLIAETESGEPMGIVWFADRKPFWRFKEQHVWIYNLNVIEKFRRKGVASELLQAAENYAVKNHLPFLALHVLDFNNDARTLYEKLGYVLVETHKESCFYQKNLK